MARSTSATAKAQPNQASPAGQSSGRYHHGDLRRALVDAAIGILDEDGIEALSLRSAARAAGVSPAAPYHHFGGKDGLLAAVATEGLQRMAGIQRELFEEAEARGDTPREKMTALGRLYVRFARLNPQLFTLMFGPVIQHREAYPELVEAYNEGYSFIERATAERLAEPGASKIPTRQAVIAAWSAVHGLANLLNDGKVVPGRDDTPSEDELVDSVLAILGRGLDSDA